MNRPHSHTIHGLDCLVSHGEEKGPAVILLHGYGADQTDLFPLTQVLRLDKAATWYVPNAPIVVSVGAFMSGRAWFPIDMVALDMAIQQGRVEDFFAHHIPDELLSVSNEMISFVEEIKKNHHKVILAGFSQGAMVASMVALKKAEILSGLVLFSGTLFNRDEVAKEVLTKKRDLVFLQSHGRQDPLLPVGRARKLFEFLEKDVGFSGQYVEFDGGHEIPPLVLEQTQKYLNQVISSES